MAEIIYKTIFQIKRGSSAEWESVNPILKEGEPGYDTTTKQLKIGDGVSTWKDLPFQGEATLQIDFIDCGNSAIF